MKISILGLGYVGAVSAACLARDGHQVVGVDTNSAKVEAINAGRSPIVEAGLSELLRAVTASGLLRATIDASEAIAATDASLICVGTPGLPNGGINSEFLSKVAFQIGTAVRVSGKNHIVIVRSTVLPGTTRNIIIPALCEGFGGNISGRISVAINPEFLREGTAIEDYLNPPKTIVGSDDVSCADAVANIYAKISAPVFRTSVEVAEMAKYVDNSWHALKVTFANEIGWLCGRLGVDSSQVMDIFVKDTKLNISPYYLRPGFAFGGSCLPKDVRALVHRAKATDLTLPVLENIMNSNRQQLERVIDLVVASPGRRVAILGLTFKANTDDLRESPFVELTERIIGKGYDVRIYDHNISMQAMVGANKEYAERMIPHLSRLLVHSITDALSHAETVIVSHATPETLTVPALMREHQTLIDLTRLSTRRETAGHYVGIN